MFGKPMKQLIIAIACVLVVISAVVGLFIWNFERPPFPLSRLERLHAEMTTNDVRQILGVPSSSWVRTNEAGHVYSEWAYSRQSSWPIVYVYFKPDGTFDRHRYDP
jgi:hypothetical protein